MQKNNSILTEKRFDELIEFVDKAIDYPSDIEEENTMDKLCEIKDELIWLKDYYYPKVKP